MQKSGKRSEPFLKQKLCKERRADRGQTDRADFVEPSYFVRVQLVVGRAIKHMWLK